MRKKKLCEIVKEKLSEREETNVKSLAIKFKGNDEIIFTFIYLLFYNILHIQMQIKLFIIKKKIRQN